MSDESLHYDVVIVGGGPAGLACAIRLKQIAAKRNNDIRICVLEKAASIGAHTLSGAVMDVGALSELLPDWQTRQAPITQKVISEAFWYLGKNFRLAVPPVLLPAALRNHDGYIVRLGHVVQWLGQQAEALGVDVFAGFAANEVLFGADGNTVIGVKTGDMGIKKDGSRSDTYQPGVAIYARYSVFAEGARGQLGRVLEERLQLRPYAQHYALGIKELWQVDNPQHRAGSVLHTFGHPLNNRDYGGGFVYHLPDGLISMGLVVGLQYRNPYLSPYQEFQKFKQHPQIRRFLSNGKRIGYGARAIAAGGWQSLPQLSFKGGVLVGDNAGFLNPARIKGSHAAIKSGMLAAEAIAAALLEGRQHDSVELYGQLFAQSWLAAELHDHRNFKPAMRYGMWQGAALFGVEQWLTKGKHGWTMAPSAADHSYTQAAALHKPIAYSKPDGVVSFDRLSSVFLSNTHHNEDQPAHLKLRQAELYESVNIALYAAPETQYCPAGVYELVDKMDGDNPAAQNLQKKLQINAANCIHCKTCDIKDPQQNIVWHAPEGGQGPLYNGM